MSCWVVPSVAAVYWQVSVERIHQMIAEGAIATKQEMGFTVVDVAPESAAMTCGRQPHPPTYRPIPREERRGAHPPPVAQPKNHPERLPTIEMDRMRAEGDWRGARTLSSRARRAPGAGALAA